MPHLAKDTHQIVVRDAYSNNRARHHVVQQHFDHGFREAVVGIVRHQLLWFEAGKILDWIGYGWGCGWRGCCLALGGHVVTTDSCTTNAWEIRNMTG